MQPISGYNMETTHVDQLISHIEAVQTQLWVTTGLVGFLIIVVGYLMKSMIDEFKGFMGDTRDQLSDQSSDIKVLQSQHEIGEHFEKAAKEISEAIDRKSNTMGRA